MIIEICESLNKHNEVFLFITNDPTSEDSKIMHVKEAQEVTHAFYKHLGAPYDKESAKNGARLFAQARAHGKNPAALIEELMNTKNS